MLHITLQTNSEDEEDMIVTVLMHREHDHAWWQLAQYLTGFKLDYRGSLVNFEEDFRHYGVGTVDELSHIKARTA